MSDPSLLAINFISFSTKSHKASIYVVAQASKIIPFDKLDKL